MTDACQHSVLVVDDDRDILRLVLTILRKLNLRVLCANSGEEALQMVRTLPSPPDMLLTDVVMPGVNGPALAAQVMAICPDVRILFMSGFDNRLIQQKFVVDPEFPLISKPFSLEDLGRRVMEMLGCGTRHLQLHA